MIVGSTRPHGVLNGVTRAGAVLTGVSTCLSRILLEILTLACERFGVALAEARDLAKPLSLRRTLSILDFVQALQIKSLEIIIP